MKVSYAIELLQKYYKPDDHVVMAWWDKEWLNSTADLDLTDEQWETIAENVDENLDGLGDTMTNEFQHAIELENYFRK